MAGNGLATIEGRVPSLVTSTQSVGGAFKHMADRIVADLTRRAAQEGSRLSAPTKTILVSSGHERGRYSAGTISEAPHLYPLEV